MTATSDPRIEIIRLVRGALAEHQARNPGFSLRAFSRRMKVSPAELSLIFRGKRQLTRRMGEKLLEGLALDPVSARTLLERLPHRLSRKKRAPHVSTPSALKYVQLSADEFNVVADWYYLAILSLAETAAFQSDPQWIAERLGIRRQEAISAIATLVRLGLLERKKRSLGLTGRRFTTTQDIPSAPIRKNHAQALELARRALDETPVELREFGASIIAADPDLLPEAKARLRELRREVSRILESGKKKEVYRLSVQLIPLSRPLVAEKRKKGN